MHSLTRAAWRIPRCPAGHTRLRSGVAVRQFAINCGCMGAGFPGNHRRRSAPVVKPLNFPPLTRPEIAELPAHVPRPLSLKHKKMKCVELFRAFALHIANRQTVRRNSTPKKGREWAFPGNDTKMLPLVHNLFMIMRGLSAMV